MDTNTTNHRPFIRLIIMALLASLVAVTSGSILAQRGSAAPAPNTFGDMPDDLVVGGKIDLSSVPDFISAVDSSGKIVGYVQREELIPIAPNGDLLLPSNSQTVYARDGKTVVGRMDAGVGFTPVGSDTAPPTNAPPPTTIEAGQE